MRPFQYSALETERTILKVLTLEYVNEVFQLFSDPMITRYMDIEPCKDIKEAEEIINYHLEDAGCRWGIFDKVDQSFMGTCGFHYLRKTEKGIVAEFGYDLGTQYWGKGYMFEVLNSLIDYGFKEMNLETIDATVDPNNIKSIKLLERLKFHQLEVLVDNLLYYQLGNK